MSTPTMTRAAYDALPPSLTDGEFPPHFSPSPGMRLDAILGVATELTAAGYPIGASMERAQTLRAAARAAVAHNNPGWRLDGINVLALDPEQAADIARQTAADALVRREQVARNVADEAFDSALYAAVTVSFRDDTQPALTKMAADFDAALEAIRKAHRAKITSDTTRDHIIDNGTPAQLVAYRELGPAVATLNRLASLRIRLCNIAALGPTGRAIACLITGPADLDSASNVYGGQTMTVLIDASHPAAGPVGRTVTKPRLGGPWLALIEKGYTPRINTADEADAVAEVRS